MTNDTLLAKASLISYVASGETASCFVNEWNGQNPLPESVLESFDKAFEPESAWRREPFGNFIMR
jgi:hypothetical protein